MRFRQLLVHFAHTLYGVERVPLLVFLLSRDRP